MFASPIFDVAGPGALILFGGVFFVGFLTGTLVVETLVLWLLKWGSFYRSLLAAFLMNLASTLLGFVLFGLSLLGVDSLSLVFFGFILSVAVEGGVLMLMKKGAARQNWIVALAANIASYILLACAVFSPVILSRLQ